MAPSHIIAPAVHLTKAAIEAIIKDYLLKNPEVVQEAMVRSLAMGVVAFIVFPLVTFISSAKAVFVSSAASGFFWERAVLFSDRSQTGGARP